MGQIDRTGGRVLVVDARDRVLLLRGSDPADPGAGDWWFTPGGGLEPGETPEQGARRELLEETGLAVDSLGAPVWRRTVEFSFMGDDYRQAETFYLARVDGHDVDFSGHTALERASVHEYRWWPLDELAGSGVTVYPSTLPDELRHLLAEVAAGRSPAEPRDVGP